MAGLALTRLSKSLYDVAYIFWLNHHRKGGDTPPVLVTDDGIPFDHDSVMSGVRPALDHLRSLGFVYLDIKTENIMWAWDEAREGEPKTGRWCLIDFGDVYPPGKVFEHPPGTYGWNSDEGGVAEDLLEISLGYLTTYLKTGKRKFDGCPDSPAQIALAKIRDEARERRKELAKKVVAEGSKVGEVE